MSYTNKKSKEIYSPAPAKENEMKQNKSIGRWIYPNTYTNIKLQQMKNTTFVPEVKLDFKINSRISKKQ